MIYAIDFDGTIFRNDGLDESMLARIKELRAAGDKVYVHTSRQGKALAAAEDLLKNVELDGIVGGKFFADYYIDDRNMNITDFLQTEEARKMTPNDKTKFKETAQTRALAVFSSGHENRRIDTDHYVEGYAARYEPYVLYYDRGMNGEEIPIYERFEPGCFAGADMGDIIMQYDHEGKVLARTGNGSLLVEADDVGLFFAADLGRTEAARSLYDDVKAGMVTKMSWRFRVGDYYYDHENHTIVHTRIAKVYDVAPVSIPANDNTDINARAWVDGEIAQAARREAELNERRRKLRVKINNTIGGI